MDGGHPGAGFDPLVDKGHPKGVIYASEPLEAFLALQRRSHREDRPIVAWSTRELNEIVSTEGISAGDMKWWSESLVNALPPAKTWVKRTDTTIPEIKATRGGRANCWSLSGLRMATEYGEVARLFETGSTASRIHSVRGQLQTRSNYADLTAVAKRKWTDVLTHNFHDCAGLPHVVRTVACS